MNITLICGHYLPKLGYLEVHLARAMAGLGHQVSVVTTSAVPPYVAHLQEALLPGNEMDGPVKVNRLQATYTLGQVVTARGLKEAVMATQPDLLIVIGLGKRFPKPVFALDVPVISLFGDNHHSYAGGSVFAKLKTQLQFDLLKASTYKAAIDRSAALVAYTPESFEAAAGMLGGKYAAKLRAQNHFISLGFDPGQFYFDPALRQMSRQNFGFSPDEKVIITATRVVAEKNLEACLPLFAALPAQYRWLIVGGDGGAYAGQFAEKAKKALGNHRFEMRPYADRGELNAIFNACDAALYTVPAISVFEVMGSGLPCLLPAAPSLSHIFEHPNLGLPFDPDRIDDAVALLQNIDTGAQARRLRAEEARLHYSWASIAGQLLYLCKAH